MRRAPRPGARCRRAPRSSGTRTRGAADAPPSAAAGRPRPRRAPRARAAPRRDARGRQTLVLECLREPTGRRIVLETRQCATAPEPERRRQTPPGARGIGRQRALARAREPPEARDVELGGPDLEAVVRRAQLRQHRLTGSLRRDPEPRA